MPGPDVPEKAAGFFRRLGDCVFVERQRDVYHSVPFRSCVGWFQLMLTLVLVILTGVAVSRYENERGNDTDALLVMLIVSSVTLPCGFCLYCGNPYDTNEYSRTYHRRSVRYFTLYIISAVAGSITLMFYSHKAWNDIEDDMLNDAICVLGFITAVFMLIGIFTSIRALRAFCQFTRDRLSPGVRLEPGQDADPEFV